MKYSFALLIFSFLIYSFNCSFQSKLFNQMNQNLKRKNLIISPLSIFQILSLTANGARGRTLSEMLEFLQHEDLEELNEINKKIIEIFKEASTLEIANAVMTKFKPLEKFVEITKEYSAPVEPLISEGQVNKWVSEKTHGKITKILDKLTPDMVMILVNAVYFKGTWSKKFKKTSTEKLPFYNLGTEEIKVDTMTQTEKFPYYEDEKIQAVSLKYTHDNMSAVIILPKKGIDINEYIDVLAEDDDEYKKVIEGLRDAKVRLYLPKFELNFEQTLNSVLKELGMVEAFNQARADFSGMKKRADIYVNEVIHKTFLKVDEEGTEAAGSTGVGMRTRGMKPKEKIYQMRADRPFLFLLKNDKLPFGYDLLFMSKIEKLK